MKARILQIADVYDALVTDRPYRMALSSDEALLILGDEVAQGWLDAFLVSKFSELRELRERLRASGRSMLASYYRLAGTGRIFLNDHCCRQLPSLRLPRAISDQVDALSMVAVPGIRSRR